MARAGKQLPPGEQPGCGLFWGEGVKESFLEGTGICSRVGPALRGAVCGVPASRRGLLRGAAGAGCGTGRKFPVALGNESGRLLLRHPPGSRVRHPPSQPGAPMGARVAACPAMGSLALHLAGALREEG